MAGNGNEAAGMVRFKQAVANWRGKIDGIGAAGLGQTGGVSHTSTLAKAQHHASH